MYITSRESHFPAKSQAKNKKVVFYLSTKSHKDLKVISSEVFLWDASACDVQKYINLGAQKQLVFNFA